MLYSQHRGHSNGAAAVCRGAGCTAVDGNTRKASTVWQRSVESEPAVKDKYIDNCSVLKSLHGSVFLLKYDHNGGG